MFRLRIHVPSVATSRKLLMHKAVMSPLARDDLVLSSFSRGRPDKPGVAVLRKSSGTTLEILLTKGFRLLKALLQGVLDGRGGSRLGFGRVVLDIAARVMRATSHLRW